jgi:hypothetical protein
MLNIIFLEWADFFYSDYAQVGSSANSSKHSWVSCPDLDIPTHISCGKKYTGFSVTFQAASLKLAFCK